LRAAAAAECEEGFCSSGRPRLRRRGLRSLQRGCRAPFLRAALRSLACGAQATAGSDGRVLFFDGAGFGGAGGDSVLCPAAAQQVAPPGAPVRALRWLPGAARRAAAEAGCLTGPAPARACRCKGGRVCAARGLVLLGCAGACARPRQSRRCACSFAGLATGSAHCVHEHSTPGVYAQSWCALPAQAACCWWAPTEARWRRCARRLPAAAPLARRPAAPRLPWALRTPRRTRALARRRPPMRRPTPPSRSWRPRRQRRRAAPKACRRRRGARRRARAPPTSRPAAWARTRCARIRPLPRRSAPQPNPLLLAGDGALQAARPPASGCARTASFPGVAAAHQQPLFPYVAMHCTPAAYNMTGARGGRASSSWQRTPCRGHIRRLLPALPSGGACPAQADRTPPSGRVPAGAPAGAPPSPVRARAPAGAPTPAPEHAGAPATAELSLAASGSTASTALSSQARHPACARARGAVWPVAHPGRFFTSSRLGADTRSCGPRRLTCAVMRGVARLSAAAAGGQCSAAACRTPWQARAR